MPTKPPIPPVRTPTRSAAPHVAQALARTLPPMPVPPASPASPASWLPAAPVQAKPQPGAGPRPPAPHVQAALATLAGTAQAMPARRFPPGVRPPAAHVQTAVAQPKLRPMPTSVPAAPAIPHVSRPAPPIVRTPPAYPARSASPVAPPPVVQPASYTRPGFTPGSKVSAYLSHNLLSDYDFEVVDLKTPRLRDYNAAMPHRMSFKDIKDSVKRFDDGEEDKHDLKRWTDRFLKAGKEKIRETEETIAEKARELRRARRSYEDLKKNIEGKEGKLRSAQKKKDKSLEDQLRKELKKEEGKRMKRRGRLSRQKEEQEGLELLLEKQTKSQEDFLEARTSLIASKSNRTLRKFLIQANSFHANVPDLGPDLGVNNPVREHVHLNLRESRSRKRKRSPSPMSRRVLDMSPERVSSIAVDEDDKIITTGGEVVKTKYLGKDVRKRIEKHGTTEIKSYDPNFTKFK